MKRRYFLKLGSLLGLSSISAPQGLAGQASGKAVRSLAATPAEIMGPFYPLVAQADTDFDLTRIAGRDGIAQGTHVYIEGIVVDTAGHNITDATVDVWQANSFGRYRHPHDSSNASLDDNFQGWAIVNTGNSGKFRFKTVIPGPYSASSNWQRPPHIHFKVAKRGFEELVTQMYFPGQKLNDTDRLLKKKTPQEQALMVARKCDKKKASIDVYHYKIVLKQA